MLPPKILTKFWDFAAGIVFDIKQILKLMSQMHGFSLSNSIPSIFYAGLLLKLKSYWILGQIFGLIYSFLSNRQFQVVLDDESFQEYQINAGVPHGFILGPTLFLLYINDLLTMLSVVLLSMLMILLSILSVIRHLICGNNLNWLLNLNLIYETLWTGVRSALLISMLGKLSWFAWPV